MKTKTWMGWLVVAAVCILVLPPVHAGTYHSDMEYSIQVPEGWTILNKENIQEHPEIVDAAAAAAGREKGFEGIPSSILMKTKQLIVGGGVDYFYSPEKKISLSVCKEFVETPESGFQKDAYCNQLSKKLEKANEKEINVHRCESRTLDGHPALYLVADDYWKNRKYIQYILRKDGDEILLFTANSRERFHQQMHQEVEQVMQTVSLD